MSIPKKPKSPEVQTPGNVAVQKQGAISPASARPKIEGRKLPSNIHLVPGRKPRRNQQLGSVGGAVTQSAIAPGFASGTVSGATDIEELARALKDNVDLIYEFVHNQIEWLPTYGSQKGAFGTLVDGFGNSFDQAELMIELLREAGYTANFQFGELELSQTDASAWFGSDASNIWAASNLLSAGGLPNTVIWTGSAYKIQFNHVWVKVNISGTDYHFDPARKTYDDVAGVNLATAMGYSQSTFLSNAKSGATVTSDYVQNIHRSNLRGDLDDYTANLVSWIKSNNPDATLDDLLGGRTIVATTGTLRNTSLSYLKPSSSVTTWTAIPDAYKATLGVLYDTINVSFFSKDVHGKRLTLFFNSSNQAELRLDGSLIATSRAQGTGTWNSVLLSVEHPYSSTFADQSFWQTVWAGKYYLIAQAWGNAGRNMIEVHRKKLD
ncbi:MAG TPA: transglutaminase domain-containing protein, partial [Candidatus Melainabacteria bacterium]|nr:transglutaminase domain-containing protein [Candidatus Melainabacteria bacterium]